jgi:hypothetical protein
MDFNLSESPYLINQPDAKNKLASHMMFTFDDRIAGKPKKFIGKINGHPFYEHPHKDLDGKKVKTFVLRHKKTKEIIAGVTTKNDGDNTVTHTTAVHPDHQGKNFGVKMYLKLRKLGHNLQSSSTQTAGGAKLWDRLRKSKLPVSVYDKKTGTSKMAKNLPQSHIWGKDDKEHIVLRLPKKEKKMINEGSLGANRVKRTADPFLFQKVQRRLMNRADQAAKKANQYATQSYAAMKKPDPTNNTGKFGFAAISKQKTANSLEKLIAKLKSKSK